MGGADIGRFKREMHRIREPRLVSKARVRVFRVVRVYRGLSGFPALQTHRNCSQLQVGVKTTFPSQAKTAPRFFACIGFARAVVFSAITAYYRLRKKIYFSAITRDTQQTTTNRCLIGIPSAFCGTTQKWTHEPLRQAAMERRNDSN
jgi:hypothetical protein